MRNENCNNTNVFVITYTATSTVLTQRCHLASFLRLWVVCTLCMQCWLCISSKQESVHSTLY